MSFPPTMADVKETWGLVRRPLNWFRAQKRCMVGRGQIGIIVSEPAS